MEIYGNTPSIDEAKDAYRDSAALLLNLFKNDIPAINDIFKVNSDKPEVLLSGMIAVAAMIAQRAFEGEALPMIESLVEYLAEVPDEEWQKICSNARTIQG